MRRLTAVLAAITLLAGASGIAVSAGAWAHAAAASPPREIDWFAPGDSYTSGHGTPGASSDPVCRRSNDSWVFQARDDLPVSFPVKNNLPTLAACTGDTTDQFDKQWDHRQHDLITFTFGGDNVNFGDVLRQCAEEDVGQAVSPLFWLHDSVSNCPGDTTIRSAIANFAAPYRSFLIHVVTDATTAGGNIVVVGYPDIFADPARWSGIADVTNVCNGVTDADVKLIRGWAADLNATIGQAVADVNSQNVAGKGVHLTFVNVDDQLPATPGQDSQNLFEPPGDRQVHTLCGNADSWMNGLAIGKIYIRAFHPNARGHAAEGKLVADVIQTLDWSSLATTTDATVTTPAPPPPTAAASVPATVAPSPAGSGALLAGMSQADIAAAFCGVLTPGEIGGTVTASVQPGAPAISDNPLGGSGCVWYLTNTAVSSTAPAGVRFLIPQVALLVFGEAGKGRGWYQKAKPVAPKDWTARPDIAAGGFSLGNTEGRSYLWESGDTVVELDVCAGARPTTLSQAQCQAIADTLLPVAVDRVARIHPPVQADTGTPALSATGIGDAHLGDDPATVIAYLTTLFGPPNADTVNSSPGACTVKMIRTVAWGSLRVDFAASDHNTGQPTARQQFIDYVYAGDTSSSPVSPPGLRTDQGIGLYDQATDLLTRYPQLEYSTDYASYGNPGNQADLHGVFLTGARDVVETIGAGYYPCGE